MARHNHLDEHCHRNCPVWQEGLDGESGPERIPFDPTRMFQPRPPSPMQVGMLTEALTIETREAYLRNPEFHQSIDLIARTLPMFVQFMSAEAQRAEALRRLMRQMDMTMPSFESVLRRDADLGPRSEDNRG